MFGWYRNLYRPPLPKRQWIGTADAGGLTGASGVAVSTWVALAGAAIMGAVSASPAVSTAQWVSPVPVAIQGAVVAVPSAATFSWVAPVPTAVRGTATALPAASIFTWTAPVPVAVRGAVVGAPSTASTFQWTTPVPVAVRGAVTGTPPASSFTWVASVPTGGSGLTANSGVAVSTWVVPAPTASRTVTAVAGGASIGTWVTPFPNAIAGATTASAAASTQTWVSPVPLGAAISPDTDLVVVGDDTSGQRYRGSDRSTQLATGIDTAGQSIATASRLVPRYRGTERRGWFGVASQGPISFADPFTSDLPGYIDTVTIPPVSGSHAWTRVSNELQSSGLALAMRVKEVYTHNVRVRTKLVTANLNQGLCIRYYDPTHFWIVLTRNDTQKVQLIRYDEHAILFLPQVDLSGPAVGQELDVRAYENQYAVYVGGVRLHVWEGITDTFPAGTKHGLLVNTNTPPSTFDDLAIDPVFAPEV